ncbi:MAG: hypothetical protein Q7T11_08530, partial [Deltaproteobacteria bacterium]|nr:hypothetical protein [Deltaproteobacteria bacterium]
RPDSVFVRTLDLISPEKTMRLAADFPLREAAFSPEAVRLEIPPFGRVRLPVSVKHALGAWTVSPETEIKSYGDLSALESRGALMALALTEQGKTFLAPPPGALKEGSRLIVDFRGDSGKPVTRVVTMERGVLMAQSLAPAPDIAGYSPMTEEDLLPLDLPDREGGSFLRGIARRLQAIPDDEIFLPSDASIGILLTVPREPEGGKIYRLDFVGEQTGIVLSSFFSFDANAPMHWIPTDGVLVDGVKVPSRYRKMGQRGRQWKILPEGTFQTAQLPGRAGFLALFNASRTTLAELYARRTCAAARLNEKIRGYAAKPLFAQTARTGFDPVEAEDDGIFVTVKSGPFSFQAVRGSDGKVHFERGLVEIKENDRLLGFFRGFLPKGNGGGALFVQADSLGVPLVFHASFHTGGLPRIMAVDWDSVNAPDRNPTWLDEEGFIEKEFADSPPSVRRGVYRPGPEEGEKWLAIAGDFPMADSAVTPYFLNEALFSETPSITPAIVDAVAAAEILKQWLSDEEVSREALKAVHGWITRTGGKGLDPALARAFKAWGDGGTDFPELETPFLEEHLLPLFGPLPHISLLEKWIANGAGDFQLLPQSIVSLIHAGERMEETYRTEADPRFVINNMRRIDLWLVNSRKSFLKITVSPHQPDDLDCPPFMVLHRNLRNERVPLLFAGKNSQGEWVRIETEALYNRTERDNQQITLIHPFDPSTTLLDLRLILGRELLAVYDATQVDSVEIEEEVSEAECEKMEGLQEAQRRWYSPRRNRSRAFSRMEELSRRVFQFQEHYEAVGEEGFWRFKGVDPEGKGNFHWVEFEIGFEDGNVSLPKEVRLRTRHDLLQAPNEWIERNFSVLRQGPNAVIFSGEDAKELYQFRFEKGGKPVLHRLLGFELGLDPFYAPMEHRLFFPIRRVASEKKTFGRGMAYDV